MIVLLALLWQGSPRKVAHWRNHKRAWHTSLAWQWVFPGPTSQKTLKWYRKSLWSFSRETGNICVKVFFFSVYSLKLLENIIFWLQGDFLSFLEIVSKLPGLKNHYHLHRTRKSAWVSRISQLNVLLYSSSHLSLRFITEIRQDRILALFKLRFNGLPKAIPWGRVEWGSWESNFALLKEVLFYFF